MRIPVFFNIFLLLLALSLVSCGPSSAPVYKEQLFTFGTIVEISICGVNESLARRAINEISADFDVMDKAWNPWEPGALARINQLIPTKLEFSVAPSVRPLIVKSKELYKQSRGLFNPAIGKLIELWGFNQTSRAVNHPPDAEKIAELVAQKPTMNDVILNGISVRSDNAAVELDFGAFAKGYGVDLAIEKLKEMGIENAIINAGGDLRAIGRRGNRSWRIGIRAPRDNGIIASLETKDDESVFTSGDYERFFEYQGKRYHHIIDPRSGYPATGVTSVTVIHSNAATADAAATALFVAGVENWYDVAKAMGIKYVMLIDTKGKIHMNPAMAKRIKFETEPEPDVILSAPL
jgi:thiamine biosynthesis lipoprotein